MIWDQDQEMPLGFPKVLKLPLVLHDPAICPRVRVMRILQYLSTCASVTPDNPVGTCYRPEGLALNSINSTLETLLSTEPRSLRLQP